MKKLFLFLLLSSFSTFANTPSLENLDQADVDAVTEELAANFVHTAVQPAGTLGSIFGFEVGLIAGVTETPEMERIVKETDPTTTVDMIPHAGILGVLTIPFGITGELTFIPERTISDVTIENTTFALKWTATDSVLSLPFDLAVRAHYSSNTFSYKDTISSVDTTVAFDTTSIGANVTAGIDLLIFEPYVGLGYVSSDSDVTLTGNVSIFNFTTSSSASASHSGAHFFAGTNINLLFLNIGAEYANIYGNSRYTAKLSVGF